MSLCTVAFRTLARAAALAAPLIPVHAASQQLDPTHLQQLEYRFIGPDGNRAIAIAGEPGNPLVNYIGAASGGLWKTEDAGTNWNPIFDDQPVSSIGSIAIAPSDNNVVWVGTGETFVIRPAHSLGNGVYRSTDAGKTWTHVGLDGTGRIGKMAVDARNPDVAFACALGHTHGPQEERGVFRTKDGGATWERVLFVNENTGCADLAMDPTNSRILYAGTWEVFINTWGLNSGGPGSGVFKSTDGGDTWTRLWGGLPGGDDHHVGKIAVGVAQSDPNIVYALIEDASPGFYRSANGGETWTLMSQNHTMLERAPYYTRFAIAPDNENQIYFLSVRFSMSVDGGATLSDRPPRGGGDNHDMWIDPTNPNRMMVAHDGGASISLNRGRTFERVVPPIAQMYHVAVDNQIPYYVYGNRQDGYSYRGPSNSRRGGSIPIGLWHSVGGCESGFATPDPVDNNIVWSGCYDGGLERFDLRTGQTRNVRRWPEAGYGWPPAELRFRWHWNFAFAISPHDHNRVYVGSQYVHQTTDGGNSWTEISPDLTLNDKSHQQSSGGVAIDNLMTFDGSVLFAIDESPMEDGVIWAGTNDGQVQITRNGGGLWSNVTANIPNLPPWGTVSSIDASRHEAGVAYITVDLHQMGDFDPYIYKATNYGQQWSHISGDIPKSILSFTHVVQEDPERPGMLYAGTDNAVYVTLDDGAHWAELRNNMPPAPVYWLTVQEHFSDLVVATYGRGFYIMDDVTPLRATTADALASDVHFFEPRPAYRFQQIFQRQNESNALNTGRNPPYGASLNYSLASVPSGNVSLEVQAPDGEVIRTIRGSKDLGINRVWWDLRHESPPRARLRTAPPGKEHVKIEDEWRPLVTWDLDLVGGQRGSLTPPGTYTVNLKIGDDVHAQTLLVRKDPHSTGSEADIEAQVARSLQMRAELTEIVDMINEIEWLRKDLENLATKYEGDTSVVDILEHAKVLEAQAIAVEGNLFDVNLTGAREDAFRTPMKLYGRLSALASDLGRNGADFAPTTQQVEVHVQFQAQLADYRALYEELMATDVPALLRLLRDRGLPDVISLKRGQAGAGEGRRGQVGRAGGR